MNRFFAALAAFAALMFAQMSIAQPLLTMYKTPNCGCCVDWAEYLRKEGFEVRVMDRHDLAPIKQAAGVRPEMASCHTALIDGYVIEGHVPAGPIRKLLAERPATRGLAVPGMPLNSPGMGPMDGKLKTYTLEGRVYSVD